MSLRSFQDRRCSRVGEGNRRRGAADYVGFGVGIVGSGDGGARDRAVLVRERLWEFWRRGWCWWESAVSGLTFSQLNLSLGPGRRGCDLSFGFGGGHLQPSCKGPNAQTQKLYRFLSGWRHFRPGISVGAHRGQGTNPLFRRIYRIWEVSCSAHSSHVGHSHLPFAETEPSCGLCCPVIALSLHTHNGCSLHYTLYIHYPYSLYRTERLHNLQPTDERRPRRTVQA